MTYILDACAMIAYLRGEAGADVVSAILIDSTHEPLAHALNLCEVYYDFYRASGADCCGRGGTGSNASRRSDSQ